MEVMKLCLKQIYETGHVKRVINKFFVYKQLSANFKIKEQLEQLGGHLGYWHMLRKQL